MFTINSCLTKIKLCIPCMVEPAGDEEDNDDDDEVHNDLIRIAVPHTSIIFIFINAW